MSSCGKRGCTDNDAYNYNENASVNDGTCEYILGCTDSQSLNYNPSASMDDGTCEYEGNVLFWTDDSTITFQVFYEGVESQQSILSSQEEPSDCSDVRHVILTLPAEQVEVMVKIYRFVTTQVYTIKFDVEENACQKILIN